MNRFSGSIFLQRDGDELVELIQQQYASEDLLQRLLADHPNLLAGDQITPAEPRRWAMVRREAGVPDGAGSSDRWSLDNLFLDQDAIPTLVEVKRSSDTRIRREVVGQMLDYAANSIAHWPASRMRIWFEDACEQRGCDPAEEIAALCGDEDGYEYWQQVDTNLRAGRVRLVFVADEIPDELRRIIEFLNNQMDPASVVGIEVPQFVGQGFKTLVPRVVGVTAEARQRKSGPVTSRSRLTREEFLESFGDESARVAVDGFLNAFDVDGLICFIGSKGCSIRLAVPGSKQPISVAWLHPPGPSGWMGFRDLTIGLQNDAFEKAPNHREALDRFLSGVRSLAASTAVPKDWFQGVELRGAAMIESLPEVQRLVLELREAVPSS